MGKFINPFSDWGFKLIFGQEITKDLLICFLNDLLKGEHTITDLTFKDKEQLLETKGLPRLQTSLHSARKTAINMMRA